MGIAGVWSHKLKTSAAAASDDDDDDDDDEDDDDDDVLSYLSHHLIYPFPRLSTGAPFFL
jgi:hypothetical protein